MAICLASQHDDGVSVDAEGGLGEQQFQIFPAQVADQAVVLADDGGSEIAFGFLQFQNFLFHRIARNQPISEDLPRLAGAAVKRSRFRYPRATPGRATPAS